MHKNALESLRSPCHRPPQKLQIDCGALQDHLILYAFYLICLSLVGFVFVFGLFVCFCTFVCPDNGLFDDEFCLFCKLACGCALVFVDDVDSELVFDFGLFATITVELYIACNK